MFPIAFGCLFGLAIGLPTGLKMFIKCFGDRESKVGLIYAIGMYSYSYTAFLLSSFVCGFVTLSLVRWLVLGYSTFISVVFLCNVYWDDLKDALDVQKRIIAVGISGVL
jgi:hypothetical protein